MAAVRTNLNSASTFVVWLAVVSGMRRDAALSGVHGLGTAALQGLAILLTTTFAFGSGGYAMSRLLAGGGHAVWIAPIAGALWATVIFVLDSVLIRSINKFRPNNIWLGLGRLLLSLVIGLILSLPLELLAARPLIETQIRVDTQTREDAESRRNAGIEDLPGSETQLQQDGKDLQEEKAALKNWNKSPEALAAAAAVSAEAGARAKLQREQEFLRGGGTIGPETWTTLRANVRATVAASQAADANLQNWRIKKEKLVDRLTTLTESSRTRRDAAQQNAAVRNTDSQAAIAHLMRPALIRELLVFEHMQYDRSNPDRGVLLFGAWGLRLLFCLIELLPLGAKLLSEPTPLDRLNEAYRQKDLGAIARDEEAEASREAHAHRAALACAAADARRDEASIRHAAEHSLSALQAWAGLEKVNSEHSQQILAERKALLGKLAFQELQDAATLRDHLRVQRFERQLTEIQSGVLGKEAELALSDELDVFLKAA